MNADHTFSEDYFALIVGLYTESVYRFAYLYLKNDHDTEDAAQEVFLKFYRNGFHFPDDPQAKAWLMKVTSNYCKDVQKSAWRKKIAYVDPDEIGMGEPDKYNDEKSEVVKLVMELPEIYKSVIFLYYYDGYPIGDISTILHTNKTVIKTRLKRGRDLLRKRMPGKEELF